MRILITGIAGFIGSKIAEEAIRRGYEVIGVDDLSQGFRSNVPSDCKFIHGDLTDISTINDLPKDIDYILHLAGQSSGEISFDDPVLDLEKNAVSTLKLINYGIEIKAKRLIYASSMSVYGVTQDVAVNESNACKPLSCYGVGKLAAENYLEIYKDQLPYTTFRMFNVYGPGQDLKNLRQGMVSIYIAYVINEGHIPVKGGTHRFRDFVYIDDVVNAWLAAITNPGSVNQCFNLGTGKKTTVAELLAKIKKIIPDFTWAEIESTKGDQFGIYADTSKFRSCFESHSLTELEDGLSKFIQWSKQKIN
jgi:UDP-glucose 4-epimerase